VPLQLTNGQTVTNLRVMMARGAVITGRLRTDDGGPVPGLQVAAFRLPPPGPAQNLEPAGVATSDDRGVYRIFGLPPGRYVVATTMRSTTLASDIAVLPASEIDRALRELSQRTGLAIASSPPPEAAAPLAPGTYAYAATFYPGTPIPDPATAIALDAGDERVGIDIPVRLTRMATIQGTLTMPDGSVPTIQLAIRTDGLRLPSLIGSVPTLSVETGPSSRTFTYTNVAPGRYVIVARTRTDSPFWARADVEVAGDDIRGQSLTLQPAIRMTGRVLFEGTSPRPDPSALGIRLTAANGAGGGASGSTQLGNLAVPAGTVDASGQFQIAGIIPDLYTLTTALAAASGWWLKSAIVNGRDVADHLLDVPASGDITGAVLTFSDRQTTLTGTLFTAAGQVAPNYFIAVFPADRALWRPGGRRIQSARSGTDGRWMLRNLPPGEYFVAALTDLGPEDLFDAALFDRLTAAAIRVTLADGEQKTQDLKLGG
jgi:hypothetical protein